MKRLVICQDASARKLPDGFESISLIYRVVKLSNFFNDTILQCHKCVGKIILHNQS